MSTVKSTLIDQVARALEQPACQVVVAYSGGVDSHVLLHAISHLQIRYPQHQYKAVHVHHGLSVNADKWLSHCQQVCEALQISFESVKVQVSNTGKGIEDAARKARYEALISSTQDDGIILLGQHSDDQLETVLLQLKRGAGPKGLSGMPQTMLQAHNIRLIRPLLHYTREDILAYADTHDLMWQEDESNQDTHYDRNFLRQSVIPLLQQRWPSINQTVQRSASMCASQQELLDEVVSERLHLLCDRQLSLDIEGLLGYSELWQDQLVRGWLYKIGAPMPSQAILAQLSNVLHAAQDANPKLSWDEWQIRRFRQRLYCIPLTPASPEVPIALKNVCQLNLPHLNSELQVSECDISDGLCLPFNKSSLSLSFCGFAARFKPEGEPNSKPLKQWFKLWDVPPWEREKVLIVSNPEKVQAVYVEGNWKVGSKPSAAHENTHTWLKLNFMNDGAS